MKYFTDEQFNALSRVEPGSRAYSPEVAEVLGKIKREIITVLHRPDGRMQVTFTDLGRHLFDTERVIRQIKTLLSRAGPLPDRTVRLTLSEALNELELSRMSTTHKATPKNIADAYAKFEEGGEEGESET